jgi:hypothetical protein
MDGKMYDKMAEAIRILREMDPADIAAEMNSVDGTWAEALKEALKKELDG